MKNKTILSVGYLEFPIGFAQVQRQALLAKAVLLEGFEVTVLCRYGIYSEKEGVAWKGIYEGINYIYCSGTSVKPERFIKRNLLKISGLLNEIRYFRMYSGSNQLAGILITTNNFYNILFYCILGKIFRVKTIVDNVEYWSSNKSIRGLDRFDKYLYDKFYYIFTDKIICISDFLIKKVGNYNKDGKLIKIPAITDFDRFLPVRDSSEFVEGKYFLFCGSDNYFEVIDFVVSSFEMLISDNTQLILVTKRTEKLLNRIARSNKKNKILIMSGIPYDDLVVLYKNSEGLIIPMRDTDQDKARFPHKISEYCASCRPIITNRVGEIVNYFNEENAYLCEGFDEKEYAGAMQKIISDPAKADRIALKSYQTGLISFNYRSYSKQLINLLS
jgi:glycosyltransferase involved in cell wall biosynthesis